MKSLLSLLISFFSLTLSAQTSDAVAKFLSSGNAYATMFFDYYYTIQGDDTYAGRSEYAFDQQNDNAFSFRRVYLGYDHTLSETFSGRVQLELTEASILETGSRSFFLKDASLRWKNIYPLADLYIGHTSSPMFSVAGSESYWRYRSIERTISDFRGLRSSSDTGLRLKGLFTSDGKSGYNFMIGNGNSTKPENDKYKIIYANIWTTFLEKKLYLEVFQDYNRALRDREIATSKGFIAWKTSGYTLGTELVYQAKSGFGYKGQDISILGISAFAHADLLKGKIRVFGRYDSFNPDVYFSAEHYDPDGSLTYEEQFISFGFDFIPHKNVNIMPNIYINNYSKKQSDQRVPATEIIARITMNVSFK